jgi:hypothetical protein
MEDCLWRRWHAALLVAKPCAILVSGVELLSLKSGYGRIKPPKGFLVDPANRRLTLPFSVDRQRVVEKGRFVVVVCS